jgi:hypothetical protein
MRVLGGSISVQKIIRLAWERFKIITSIVGEIQGNFIAILFYFTIFVPFGLASRLLSDPLQRRETKLYWSDRAPDGVDLESARRQG